MKKTSTFSNQSPRFFFLDKNFLKQNFFVCLLFPIIFGIGSGKASAQCYINMPSLFNSTGCAQAAFYPTNNYGTVETMWAKNVNGYIYSQTAWSTSTSTTFCPAEPGNYRLCARRVGCSYVYESSDIYINPCTTPDLDQYIQVDGGSYQAVTSIEVCEGQDVVLDFAGSGYNAWTFTYTGPHSLSTSQTGYSNADQLLLEKISTQQSGTYTATYVNAGGCSNSESFSITVLALPSATFTYTDPGCSNKDGSISFSFADVSGRSHIEFSIDGGASYPYNVADNAGSTSITELESGIYDLYVRWGNNDCPVALGEVTLNNTGSCASIGDFVFDDDNLNGIFDDGETGVEDVQVFLFEVGNPNPIDTDITDEFGAYLFENVIPNKSYYLSFTNLPANYQFTSNGAGNDDEKDSDVDPLTGNTPVVTPGVGDNLGYIDAGIVNSLNFPVEWLGFEAKGIANDALLSWSTATELNASHYIVERALDGRLFTAVGSVEAVGTTHETQHYSFIDANISGLGTSSISYRLKQADIDGTINYSKTIELDLSATSSFEMNVYPNPSVSSLTIEWTPVEEMQTLKILNLVGQTVYEQAYNIKTDASKLSLDVSSWPKGNYFLQLSAETVSETRTFSVK